jgi:hypothetical protein
MLHITLFFHPYFANKDPLYFKRNKGYLFYDYDLKLVYLTVCMILYYLNFLKDVLILILYTQLHELTLNHDNEIDLLHVIEMERILFLILLS